MASPDSFSGDYETKQKKVDQDQGNDNSSNKNQRKVSLLKLFTFADSYDYILMAIGSVGACIHGASVPIFFIYFGKLINVIGMAYLFPKEASHKVAKYSLDFVYLSIAILFSSWTEVACWMHTGERQAAKMRMAYLKAMLSQDISLFDTEASTGEVISAITSDIIVVQDALSEKVGNFMHYMSRFAVGFIIGFARVWQISLVTLSIVPLIALAGGVYAYVATGLIARVRKSYVKAGEIAEEMMDMRSGARRSKSVNDGQENPAILVPPTLPGARIESRPKRTRGHNRGEAAHRSVARHNKKLTVTYREGEARVLGDNARRFATDIGIIIKHHAPLQRRGWCKVLPKERDSLYARLKDIFEMDFASEPYWKVICNSSFSKQYKDYRGKCHKKYKDIVKSGKNPLQNQPSLVIRENDWKWMCNECFSNPKWQLKSEQGALNRANLTNVHRAGSKSYARHLEEQTNTQTEAEKNNGVGRIEIYKRTHWNAEHGWTCNEVEENYKEMVRLKNQQSTQLEGESSSSMQVDEAAICTQVLGPAKCGHKPGFGPVPQKKDLIELFINYRETESNKQIENLSKTVDDLQRKQEEQSKQLKHLATSFDVPGDHPSFPPRPPSPPPPPPSAPGLVA